MLNKIHVTAIRNTSLKIAARTDNYMFV